LDRDFGDNPTQQNRQKNICIAAKVFYKTSVDADMALKKHRQHMNTLAVPFSLPEYRVPLKYPCRKISYMGTQ
jgi:hypothetical protein